MVGIHTKLYLPQSCIILNKIIKMKNIIYFYSSVKNIGLFHSQQFYRIDIQILEELGYKIVLVNKIYPFLYFWRYNISFLYFYKWSLFPALISKLFNKKVYLTGGIDDLDMQYAGRKRFILQKICFKIIRLVSCSCILVSKSDIDNVKKIYKGKLPSKICFSEHSLNISSFSPVVYNKSNSFMTIAWMESKENVIRKGIDKSLYVFKYLSEKPEFSNSVYYIIGREGEGSNYLKLLCQKLDILNRVVFTGSLSEENKINMLMHNRYYFQLSIYEGFGLAALEALLSKNIVIHSGNGGLKYVIKDLGIKFDYLHNDLASLFQLYSEIISFDTNKLFSKIDKYLLYHYSNERRKNDFINILN